MKLDRVVLLFLVALTACLDEPALPDPADRAAAEPTTATGAEPTTTFKKVLVPIPPPGGGPYDICGASLCVEGYVDIRIELDPSCADGYRTFCVPCGTYPQPWCR